MKKHLMESEIILTKHNKKDIVAQGQDYEIYRVDDYFMVHIYGGPYKTLNSLEESLDWAKGFN